MTTPSPHSSTPGAQANQPATVDVPPGGEAYVVLQEWSAWRAVEERRKLVLQGQRYGLLALGLVLAAVVALAALGQPWVAGVLAGTSLSAIVAAFVAGQYVPAEAPESGLRHQGREFGDQTPDGRTAGNP